MSKLKVAEKAELRKDFYGKIEAVLDEAGIAYEPVATGLLAVVSADKMVEIRVIVKDEEKFDIDDARTEYADKCAKAAERAEQKAVKEAERAAKEKEKAEKAAAKAAAGSDASAE